MILSEKTRRDLGWDLLLAQLADRARTRRGIDLARTLTLYAEHDIDGARARIDEIREARALRDQGEPLPLDGIADLDEALDRAAKGGVLEAGVLRDVGSTLSCGARVLDHFAQFGQVAPRLSGRVALIHELESLTTPLDRAFEEGDGRVVRLADRASPALAGLRRRAHAVRDELERKLGSLLDSSHIAEHLQDRFFTQREDRYVIPVRVDARSRVRGIVHGTSQSGQTVFLEPEELVDINNRLKLAELEVAVEERRILAELSVAVQEALPQIRVNLDVLALLDLIDAGARLSADLRATPPELVEISASSDGGLDLRRARHPLMVLSGRTTIPNDIVIGNGRTLVISGPNAGGKTVALKTAGLVALMAGAGLHTPVQEGSRVPFYAEVGSDVGDDQSLERNLSTFSAHILSLTQFLARARPGLLLLLDEVAVGTDPDQGAALAQAVLEAFATAGATVVVTTHYDRLKALAARDARFANASVGFDVESLKPTYLLHLGTPGASGAIVVARRLGLSPALCSRATELAGNATTGLEQLLIVLEGERRQLDAARAEAATEIAAATHERRRAELLSAQAEERLAKARKGAHDDAVETLRRARTELDQTRTVLRRAGGQVSSALVTEAKRDLDRAAELVRQAAPVADAPPGRPATEKDLSTGRRVWVARLGGMGQVSAVKSNKVTVQAGLLKVTVPLDEVRLVDAPAPAARIKKSGTPDAPALEHERGYPQLDVRGERADAALARAEKFLDDALRTGDPAVLIVHGHGSGALRDMLRKELGRFPGVSAVHPATESQGGDGATVVEL